MTCKNLANWKRSVHKWGTESGHLFRASKKLLEKSFQKTIIQEINNKNLFNNIKCIKTWNESCRMNLELSFIHMLALCHSKENTDHRVVFQHLEDHYYIVYFQRDYGHQTRTAYTPLKENGRSYPPKVVVTSLARSTLILTNTHIFTFGGATVTKCWLQVHLLERRLVVTSHRVLMMS